MATAKTLADLRAKLAQDLGKRYHRGTATASSLIDVVDIYGLKHWATNDVLKNGQVYILANTHPGLAPENEARRITGYTAANFAIHAEYAFTSAIEVGDTYELFLSPLGINAWSECINTAIRMAYPDLWERQVYSLTMSDLWGYNLSALTECMAIESVFARPQGDMEGDPGQRLVEHRDYEIVGTPSSALWLHLLRKVPTQPGVIRIYYKSAYPELATYTSTTSLDVQYIILQAKAAWYSMMADESRGETSYAGYLQEMIYAQEQANQRKMALAQALLSQYAPAPQQKRAR
jgi:hypothetical protein